MKHHSNQKKEVIKKINKILTKKSSVIISGGNTIKGILKNYDKPISNTFVLLSDERLVKKSSKLRNDLFFKKLIKKKILKSFQFINYKYCDFSVDKINNISKKIEKINFKYAILSLGSNGHFASIFTTKNESKDFYFVNDSPKFPKKRVTVSLEKISKCEKIFFIAYRKKKKREIKNFYNNKLIKKFKKKVELLSF